MKKKKRSKSLPPDSNLLRGNEDLYKTMKIFVYQNRTEHQMATEIVVAKSIKGNWLLFLDYVGEKLGMLRAVKYLYTVKGRQVNSFKALKSDGYYVAVHDKFKRVPYGKKVTENSFKPYPGHINYYDPGNIMSQESIEIYTRKMHLKPPSKHPSPATRGSLPPEARRTKKKIKRKKKKQTGDENEENRSSGYSGSGGTGSSSILTRDEDDNDSPFYATTIDQNPTGTPDFDQNSVGSDGDQSATGDSDDETGPRKHSPEPSSRSPSPVRSEEERSSSYDKDDESPRSRTPSPIPEETEIQHQSESDHNSQRGSPTRSQHHSTSTRSPSPPSSSRGVSPVDSAKKREQIGSARSSQQRSKSAHSNRTAKSASAVFAVSSRESSASRLPQSSAGAASQKSGSRPTTSRAGTGNLSVNRI